MYTKNLEKRSHVKCFYHNKIKFKSQCVVKNQKVMMLIVKLKLNINRILEGKAICVIVSTATLPDMQLSEGKLADTNEKSG